ncbi:MAG: ATP-binding protein [Nitrococcus sp.]|nr:ATP-binding protein [Nitrococcus sp.]
MPYQRPQADTLAARLREPRRFMQIVAGPRQVGKTTLVQQVVEASGLPAHFASADEPTLRGPQWISQQWDTARLAAKDADEHGAVLGSAPLLIAQGLSESLAGRFEVLHLTHWSFTEMQAAFDWSLDDYLLYGGYPGAAPLIHEPKRWARYIRDSLIETSISRDVLLLTRVDKPALLRRLFDLACRYSGQILSYTKMLGQLQDAGNTTTSAHYLDLLAGAGMVCGLQKYASDTTRQRGSSPKLQVLNTALLTAQSGLTPQQAHEDRELWGRLVESAVGAHLVNAAADGSCTVHYWRERNQEVDFVVKAGRRLTAIEVKSARAPQVHRGTAAFSAAFKPQRSLLVGGDGIALDDFLGKPVAHWTET